ncbi:MAG: type II toxin-antitoxin system PemK/MazF family toxin [Segetibacter sp.]
MKKGSIVLVPFYFTDFTRYKLRPSLIVSNGQSNPDDYIVAFISTIIPAKQLIHETHFIIDSNENFFNKTGLKKTSLLKCDKLMTINQSIVQDYSEKYQQTSLK